jgi:radical SAM protein with 4Fe4S-binding SPASM domain
MNKPYRITIDTNPDKCNLHCIMCDTHSIYNKNSKLNRKDMSKKLLEKVFDEALEIGVKEIIPTTMGEPLLYEHFDLFIEKLSNNNTKLNLTTNGTFPKKDTHKWAEELLPILSDIKISINGIDSSINEDIMQGDNTIQKLEKIKEFIKLRDRYYSDVSITLQVTFLKSNLDEIEKIIKFAIKNNVNRVKGHQLWITYDEIKEESLQNDKNSINQWNDFVDKIKKYRTKIKLQNFDKLKLNNDNTIPYEYNCPFLGKELWIDHNGDFNICCAPSDKRISLGEWGNIQERTILDIFNSDKYLNLVKNYKEKEICKKCSLRIPKC